MEYFNNLIEPTNEHDDLGDALFGDYVDFKERFEGLSPGNQEVFMNALRDSGVIDIDEETWREIIFIQFELINSSALRVIFL